MFTVIYLLLLISSFFWGQVSCNQDWPQIPYVSFKFLIILSLSPCAGTTGKRHCVLLWILQLISIFYCKSLLAWINLLQKIKAIRNRIYKMQKRSCSEGLAHMVKEPERFIICCLEAGSLEKPVASFYLVWRPENHEFWVQDSKPVSDGLRIKHPCQRQEKIDVPIQSENNFTFPVMFILLEPSVCWMMPTVLVRAVFSNAVYLCKC